ncbi:MAG: response regulator [Candidatus Latescibacteria bacterium]|nr:response regulator [Candidatus Latescibacterota bacterium]MBT5831319.1 response regulator [Candidatus Latescibacterota bacterium]
MKKLLTEEMKKLLTEDVVPSLMRWGKEIKFIYFRRFNRTTHPKQKCVLIVDDVHTIRAIASSVFTEAGHKVIEARNGPEALDVARQYRPDLIVTDIIMQGAKQGLDFLTKLEKDNVLRSIPVIVLSGDTDIDDAAEWHAFDQVIDSIAKDKLDVVLKSLRKHSETL